MTRLDQLHGQWTADQARLEAAYAEALESGADREGSRRWRA